MTRRFIGVRWWLGVAFAVVAAVSTALVVSQFSTRSQNAFRGRAESRAAQSTKLAAQDVASLQRIARQQNIELHVYDGAGKRTRSAAPESGRVSAPSQERGALQAALRGQQSSASTSSGDVFV